jgi:hypothetical protein
MHRQGKTRYHHLRQTDRTFQTSAWRDHPVDSDDATGPCGDMDDELALASKQRKEIIGDSLKTKVCKFWASNGCFRGDNCTFLHSNSKPTAYDYTVKSTDEDTYLIYRAFTNTCW